MLRTVGRAETPAWAPWNSVCVVFFASLVVLSLALLAPEPKPDNKLVGRWNASPLDHVATKQAYQFLRNGKALRNGDSGYTYVLSGDTELRIAGPKLGEMRGRIEWEGRDAFVYRYVYYDLKSEELRARFARVK